MKFKMLSLATASLVAIATPLGAAKPVYGDWGYNAAAMDTSVKPGDDFWAYVNGNWDKTTKVAPEHSREGPFVRLSDDAEKEVRQIVESLVNDPNRDHLGQQIGDFYGSFTDTAAILVVLSQLPFT